VGLFERKQMHNVHLPGGDTVEVVEESHHQEALRAIMGATAEGMHEFACHACLIHEPGKVWDKNGVAVYIKGLLVGHLSRDDATRYAPFFDALRRVYKARPVCDALIEERDGGPYRVRLALASVQDLTHRGLTMETQDDSEL
jgi:hypothetical protein